ncbi:T9SS type A sorting domain-containing protein [candidate division KSB1 bacterium]|nr:T9SS type A sorting domain-containing protein [candidate division KSB1 bacterium]
MNCFKLTNFFFTHGFKHERQSADVWLGIVFLFVLLQTPSWATTVNVPDDQPTIQSGIDIAQQGDTVLVAAGLYAENINFWGKNITVASHYILNADPSLIEATTILGIMPSHPDTASCVVFYSGEDSTAILQGFKITSGMGTKWIDPQFPAYNWRGGGGIFIFNSSPTIKNNIITNNIVLNKTGVSGVQGGGLLTFGGNPQILENIVFANQAEYGAGLDINYSGAQIRNNLICKNVGGEAYGGAGIWVIGNGSYPIIIENNTIVENDAPSGTGANAGRGGAMFVWYGSVTARNNIIWGNTQIKGGPIAEVGGGTAHMSYCDIEGGFPGLGNIDADPGFLDSNYNLSPNSPCIDAGDPFSPLDEDGTRADMGYRPTFHLDAPYIRLLAFAIDDSQGNQNGTADAGETVNLVVTLVNSSLDGTGITVTLTNDDPELQIIQDTAGFADLPRGLNCSNLENPFVFSVNESAMPHTSTFFIHITADGNYANRDSLRLRLNFPSTLIVDDDQGAQCQEFYQQSLEELQIRTAMWDIAVKGSPSAAELEQYKNIIWFTGDSRDSTLTKDDQIAISAFLAAGGNLFLSGDNIGFDLIESGTSEDSAFFAATLNARYVADSCRMQQIYPIAQEPLTADISFNLDPGSTHTSPDMIEATGEAQLIFNWMPDSIGAGLKYENSQVNSHLVYLAFGLEGVEDSAPGMKKQFFTNIFDWFDDGLVTDIDLSTAEMELPVAFKLNQNYPNPFNCSTMISYLLPDAAQVNIEIFNTLGQKIRSLVSGKKKPGFHQILWNGEDDAGIRVASGIYMYRMQAGAYQQTKKLLFLK